MSLFLSDAERKDVKSHPLAAQYLRALGQRVARRAATPGLAGPGTTVEWWHGAAEYLTDAAMIQALEPDPAVAAWLRDATLSVARRGADEWVGPRFRDRGTPPCGHLETAHLAWSTAVALDLAGGIFTPAEQDELREALRGRGMPLCREWLRRDTHLNNWRCILTAGVAVPAAVLGDAEGLAVGKRQFDLCTHAFQPDGSYPESLQYGGYAMYGLALTAEALIRAGAARPDDLDISSYARGIRWHAASLLYRKPLAGWGPHPRPRSANFGDSGALVAASSDALLHAAARTAHKLPVEAGLARWLVETCHPPFPDDGPHDRSSFGFIPRFGFLTLPLLPRTPAALTPVEVGLPPLAAFSNGDTLARDAWDGRTILAVRGGRDPLGAVAHLHGDLNSFILVHNRERLLLDPGHSCYRNLIRDLDCASATHNTCTFEAQTDSGDGATGPQGTVELQQSCGNGPRTVRDTVVGAPLDRGGRDLIAARDDDVTVIGSEVARLYGAPLERFARFWLLCGAHALFVVDHIRAVAPVRTTWNWLLNNRDGALDLKLVPPDRLVARRGRAGLKLFHLAGGRLAGPAHGFVHDAYHTLPGQQGEGASNSGILVRWHDRERTTERLAVHAITMDDPAAVAGWHLRRSDDALVLEGPGARVVWALVVAPDGGRLDLCERKSGRAWRLAGNDDGHFTFRRTA